MATKPIKMSEPYTARRRKALAAAQAATKAGALLVTRPEDVSYLSGFTGDDSFLLIGASRARPQMRTGAGRQRRSQSPPGSSSPFSCLLTDGRYGEQAAAECPGTEVFVRKGAMSAAMSETLGRHKVRSMALQAEHLTIQWRDAMAKAMPKVRLAPAADIVGPLRQIKDEHEVAAIRRAVAAAQDAFKSLLAQGRKAFIGRTERQVAAELDYRMRLAGADKSSFETIVAAGAHGSLPHYRPGSTVIGKDDQVLIDWGAFVGGYASDLTRVVFTGRIPPQLGQVYEVVLKAQAAGIAAVRAGAALKSVDAAARRTIAAAGYGDQFVHSLGHGVGRQIHEQPAIGAKVPGRMRSGMVVTIEPGIYLPGVGGVRIEDDVLVTSGGPEVLSSLPKDLASMTL